MLAERLLDRAHRRREPDDGGDVGDHGTSRRACSKVARRNNWKAMTGAATSADDEVDYYKALASLICVKQPHLARGVPPWLWQVGL